MHPIEINILSKKYKLNSKTEATKANIINGFNEYIKEMMSDILEINGNICREIYQYHKDKNLFFGTNKVIPIGNIGYMVERCIRHSTHKIFQNLCVKGSFYDSIPIYGVIYFSCLYLFVTSYYNPKTLDNIFKNAFPNKGNDELVSKLELIEWMKTKINEILNN